MKPLTYLIYLCTALCLPNLQAQEQASKLEHGITIGLNAANLHLNAYYRLD